jgi:hyperosmotically inducible periplasmic protein
MSARILAWGLALFLAAVGATLGGCAATPQRESTGEYLDDSVITSRLKAALFRDPQVSGFRVNVETFKGQVQLAGFVDSLEQRLKAEQIARSVPGVRAVTNSIVVKAP